MNTRLLTQDLNNPTTYYASVPNTFADTLLGEKPRFQASFSRTTHAAAHKAAYVWIKKHLYSVYGKERGLYLFNNRYATTKFKFGCGVTFNRQKDFYETQEGTRTRHRIRVIWREYGNDYKPITKKKIFSVGDINNKARRNRAEHDAHCYAALIRAQISLGTIDKGVFSFDYDLDAMPAQPYKYDKTKVTTPKRQHLKL
ncbi:hypothetical protein AB4254_11885 [Vibrio breoganii]